MKPEDVRTLEQAKEYFKQQIATGQTWVGDCFGRLYDPDAAECKECCEVNPCRLLCLNTVRMARHN